ncbi:hypothetical protein CPB83DRAFT_809063 [Crepidotus variabilis]|uniref:Uncharacterized protein n=1 Tax=Crepidotus variabilis TaxID=179855 RepID=A0A9P6EMM9_9AGAR|nr:hypothetical protein CPB83DRAFT_809063 [Crepidotus variabilis]
MPDPFPVTEAQLTGMFLESICFGVLLVTLGFCLQVLFTYKGRLKRLDEVNWLMVSVTAFSFVIAVFDISIGFYHNLKIFVFLQVKGDPAEEFANISDWVNVARSVTIQLQILLGDAMLIYRCWIVWNRAFLPIVTSLFLWLAAAAMATWVIVIQVTFKSHLLISGKQLMPAITTFWALTIALNMLTTGLLVYSIWRVELGNKRVRSTNSIDRPSSLGQVIRYLIESGLLYTFTSLMTFMTVVTNSNGSYPISDAEIMIVPIAFNLIIIRTAQIGGREQSTFVGTNGSGSVPLHPLQGLPRTRESALSFSKNGGVKVVMTRDTLTDYASDKRLST